MPEEKQEKKNPAIFKRIFKWIGLGLLILLLIVALIFQAPWKVTALLFIFLSACTALPKPARKWFWLSVGAVVIVLIIWVFLPDTGDWKPYTFDEELAALEAKRAIPPEENAATIYNQLLENYNEDDFEPNLSDPNVYHLTRSEPWSSKDYPEMAEWLQGQQGTIATLMQASKIEKCRFPIPSDTFGLGESMEISDSMRRWAYLLIIAGNNDMAEGRIDQALEKYIALLQMAKHQCQQPTDIDIPFGIAFEALATKQFKKFVVTGDVTEEHLSIIERALAGIKHDWSSDLPKFIEHDKLMAKSLLIHFYEISPQSKTRLSRDPWAQMRVWMKERLDANQIEDPQTIELLKSRVYPTYQQKKLTKAGTIWRWFFLPFTPQKAAKIIDDSFEKYYAMAEPDFDWPREPPELLSLFTPWNFTRAIFNFNYFAEFSATMAEGTYYGLHDRYLQLVAKQRCSRLIIALRRCKNKHGHWPESLDDVKPLAPAEIFTDPINDGKFVYKLTEDNFTLYSKGKNNIDEDGQYNSKWDPDSRKQKIEEDDILIWPKRSQKTKEETANDK